MNNTELKHMIALVKHNLSLQRKIEAYELEYTLGKSLIDAAVKKSTTAAT